MGRGRPWAPRSARLFLLLVLRRALVRQWAAGSGLVLMSCPGARGVCGVPAEQPVLPPQGKEFETRLKEKKPGDLSDELRISLGMPVGPVSARPLGGWLLAGEQAGGARARCSLSVPQNAHKVPPPWLIAMQRYGPPPSYPNLKIPGLNSPIPEVSDGWSRPPLLMNGR